MINERNKLIDYIKTIDDDLSNLPEGNLICSHDKKKTKFYISNNNIKSYLRKSDKSLFSKYFTKRYLTLLKKEVLQEIKAIESYLQLSNSKGTDSSDFLHKYPEYADIILSSHNPSISPQVDIHTWINTPFESNPFHPEGLIFKGHSGNLLRSKSECIIDMCLHTKGIPFKYECPLQIDKTTFYPDFTILNPQNGNIIYWEHLGMLDNPEYFEKFINKIKAYAKNNIYLGINLIVTTETSAAPLDVNYVESLIKYYFL